jgi:hypothetical protein
VFKGLDHGVLEGLVGFALKPLERSFPTSPPSLRYALSATALTQIILEV